MMMHDTQCTEKERERESNTYSPAMVCRIFKQCALTTSLSNTVCGLPGKGYNFGKATLLFRYHSAADTTISSLMQSTRCRLHQRQTTRPMQRRGTNPGLPKPPRYVCVHAFVSICICHACLEGWVRMSMCLRE